MYRLCLLLLVLAFHGVFAQSKSAYLLQAEKTKAFNTPQSIQLAQKAFQNAIREKDYCNACLSGIFLGDAYRKLGDYASAIHYDSLAVLQARHRQADTLLQQKAINSYTRNYIEQLLLQEAETLLTKDSALFTNYYSKETCFWYEMKALYFFNRIRVGDAITQGKMAQMVAQTIHDTTAMMHAQMMVFKFQSMILQSRNIDLAFESLAYFENKEHLLYAAQAANIIGYAFETTHNLDKALEYYQKALQHNITANDAKEVMQTRMHIADAYRAGQQFQLAKPILYDGYHYYSKIHILKGTVAATIRLAKIYSDTDQFDSAMFFFKLTDTLNKRLKLKIAQIGSQGWQAQLQAKMKNFRLSDSLANLAINEMLNESHQDISDAGLTRLKEAGAITKADIQKGNRFKRPQGTAAIKAPPARQMTVSDYERVENMNWQTGASSDEDSTYREKNSRQQLEAENKYKVPVLKDSLQKVQESREIMQRNLSQNRWIAIGIIILLGTVSTGLLMYYKKRNSAERERIQIQSKRSELEVYHRVENQLGVVNRLIEVAGKSETEKLPVAVLQNRIHSISLIHQLLCDNETHTGIINLQIYLDELCGHIVAVFATEHIVRISVCTPVEIESTIAEKLGLIVNELVTNSFKYAFTGRAQGIIQIDAKKTRHQLHLTVSDNGIGLPTGKLRKGYGTKLIHGTMSELKGQYSYLTEEGTCFELTIPLNR